MFKRNILTRSKVGWLAFCLVGMMVGPESQARVEGQRVDFNLQRLREKLNNHESAASPNTTAYDGVFRAGRYTSVAQAGKGMAEAPLFAVYPKEINGKKLTEEDQDRIKGMAQFGVSVPHRRQNGQTGCGLAATAMVMAFWNNHNRDCASPRVYDTDKEGDPTLVSLRTRANQNGLLMPDDGTTDGQLATLANHFGYRATWKNALEKDWRTAKSHIGTGLAIQQGLGLLAQGPFPRSLAGKGGTAIMSALSITPKAVQDNLSELVKLSQQGPVIFSNLGRNSENALNQGLNTETIEYGHWMVLQGFFSVSIDGQDRMLAVVNNPGEASGRPYIYPAEEVSRANLAAFGAKVMIAPDGQRGANLAGCRR